MSCEEMLQIHLLLLTSIMMAGWIFFPAAIMAVRIVISTRSCTGIARGSLASWIESFCLHILRQDGYIDLAIANHKVNGDHKGFSCVWWNGPNGFNRERCTELPTNGPHGMYSTEIGNIMDRSNSEYYYSPCYTVENDSTVTKAEIIGEIPPKTSVSIMLRINEGEWQKPEDLAVKAGDVLEYRLELYAYNCLRTPRVKKVTVYLEE